MVACTYKLTLKRPRFGFCFPARIFKAVDLPIPLVPTKPNTSPARGVGNLEMKDVFLYNRLTLRLDRGWSGGRSSALCGTAT